MRRGAAFERWLVSQGHGPAEAGSWAGHIVWSSGCVFGCTGLSLALATAEDVASLRVACGEEWPDMEPALAAWFDWVLPAGAVNPMVEPVRLRLVQ
jgi:hypothetical protein